ncbi:MAG: hypothetical protein EOO61_16680 [Hymenobacter sp.]|nr:MAG: hypothetical protein EOO61_16680 [Hymenobacter sp.]
MPAPIEELLTDHSYMCNALGDLMHAWHQRGDSGPLRMELLEPLAARIGFASASFENLVSGTTRGGYTDTPITFPDLASIYTIARSQLEAYLTFYYLYIGPQSDAECELKYNIYVVAGLTARQSLRSEMEELYKETKDERLPEVIAQINEEGARIERLKTIIEADALFNSLYTKSQRNSILSITQPRARTQSWTDIIKSSPLATVPFANRWSLYSNHAHSEYISLLQLSQYTMNISEHDTYTRLTALKGSLMVLSTFIGQFVDYMQLQPFCGELHTELQAMIRFWQQAAQSD